MKQQNGSLSGDLGTQPQILCLCYDATVVPFSTFFLRIVGEDIHRVIIHNFRV